ncbi:hypothetical protein [Aquibium carbonis]|uniref:hypothetical protein n=1 Tax=Aquibium carbonis TaxID=2495581 RepID=UPI001478AF3C|nr:hypothetical protein [Aquibium carbonis]
MMMDRLMALLALVVLTGFLGILVWKVPRVDLFVVVAITLSLAIWDFVANAWRRPRRR